MAMTKKNRPSGPTGAAIAGAKAILAEAYKADVAKAVEDFLTKYPRFRAPDLNERDREACYDQVFDYGREHPLEQDAWRSLVAFLATENPDLFFDGSESTCCIDSSGEWWRTAGHDAFTNDMLTRIESLWTPLPAEAAEA